jgi:hypothetical protein
MREGRVWLYTIDVREGSMHNDFKMAPKGSYLVLAYGLGLESEDRVSLAYHSGAT